MKIILILLLILGVMGSKVIQVKEKDTVFVEVNLLSGEVCSYIIDDNEYPTYIPNSCVSLYTFTIESKE